MNGAIQSTLYCEQAKVYGDKHTTQFVRVEVTLTYWQSDDGDATSHYLLEKSTYTSWDEEEEVTFETFSAKYTGASRQVSAKQIRNAIRLFDAIADVFSFQHVDDAVDLYISERQS